jgi:hypothetical protein
MMTTLKILRQVDESDKTECMMTTLKVLRQVDESDRMCDDQIENVGTSG